MTPADLRKMATSPARYSASDFCEACRKAADEIERLERDLATSREAEKALAIQASRWHQELDQAHADVARLEKEFNDQVLARGIE